MKAYKTKIVMGFSGSRDGITFSQKNGLRFWMQLFKPRFGVHGCCIGGDEVFDLLCEAAGIPRRGRPCKEPGHPARSVCQPQQIMPVMPCLDRNAIIPRESDVTIVCPKTELHENSGGSWYTYDVARIQSRNCVLILPDGEAKLDFNPTTGDRRDPTYWDLDKSGKVYVPSKRYERMA